MKKIQIIFAIMSVVIIASISAFAQNPSGGQSETFKAKETNLAPDLRIRKFVFVPVNNKAVRVYVQNVGSLPAGANRLLLIISKIEGSSVNRKRVITVPAIKNGKGIWLIMNAKTILPNDVALKTTDFKLFVDSTKIVDESNESNNIEYYEGKSGPEIDAADDLTANLGSPDLRIRQVKFSNDNDKLMYVQVYNGGTVNAPATKMNLTIGKINGVKVDRRDNFKMPLLAKGKFVWVKVDASSILPNNVSVKTTTLRLTVDFPDIIDESNESNNVYYHNN